MCRAKTAVHLSNCDELQLIMADDAACVTSNEAAKVEQQFRCFLSQ